MGARHDGLQRVRRAFSPGHFLVLQTPGVACRFLLGHDRVDGGEAFASWEQTGRDCVLLQSDNLCFLHSLLWRLRCAEHFFLNEVA